MWAHLEDAVREAAPRWKQTFGVEDICSGFFRTEEAKRDFLKGMHGFGRISSPAVAAAFDLSRFHRMIDLGGASGHLSEAVRERYPNIQAQVFDLPEVAKLYPGTIAGDFFTDPLPQADLYSVGRILHDWSDEKIHRLLARIFAALPEGGGLLIAEKLLDPGQRPSTHAVAEYAGERRRPRAIGRRIRSAAACCGLFESGEPRHGRYLDALLAIK